MESLLMHGWKQIIYQAELNVMVVVLRWVVNTILFFTDGTVIYYPAITHKEALCHMLSAFNIFLYLLTLAKQNKSAMVNKFQKSQCPVNILGNHSEFGKFSSSRLSVGPFTV